jgi:hypothetical protein
VVASVFVFQIDEVETKFLYANSISEFSHSLDPLRTSRGEVACLMLTLGTYYEEQPMPMQIARRRGMKKAIVALAVVVDSLKVLDPKRPIREADIAN